MEKGNGVMGEGRRWAVDLTNNLTSLSSRDFADPPGFSCASLKQDDSTVSRQKKDQSWWGRAEPIYVTTCPRHSKSKEGSISNLLFVNITSISENGVFLSGSKGGLLSDLRFINLDLTYRRWTNNAGGLVDYRPGCLGLVKHSTAGIIMEHINGLVIDNVNMRWSDNPLRQLNDPLDFRYATVNNISLLNFHSSLYKQ